ncbi:MAG: hypothetical protein ABIB43_02805, partial [archaeon]
VTITVDCEEDLVEDSGGGSGGGGSSAMCVSEWVCSPWTKCSSDGFTTRVCEDMNRCNMDYYIHEMELSCIYVPPVECFEDWTCKEWGPCMPGDKKTRDCKDQNNCGTEESKPEIEEECIYIPTCTDKVQNQGETGVDCGGPCLPCKKIEIPGVIKEQKNIISAAIIGSIFLIMSLLIVYKYFYKEINSTATKLKLALIRKHTKRILLSDKDKTYLLDELDKLEKSLTGNNSFQKAMELTVLCRGYFSSIFKIPITAEKELIEKYNKQLKIKELLSNVFLSFFDKTVLVETKKTQMFKTDVLVLIEELREIIHLTAKFTKTDIHSEIKEIAILKNDNPMLALKKHLFNIYIAMHFDEIEVVKQKYAEILKNYESLSEADKGKVYDDMNRLFYEVGYFLSMFK